MKQEDRESLLGDYGVRKYDADIGRFLSADKLFQSQPGYSPYHYSANDPVNGSDPSGLFMVSISNIVTWANDIINPNPGQPNEDGGSSGGGSSTGVITYDIMGGGAAVYSGSGWETLNWGNGRINNEPDKPLRSTSGGGGSGGGSPVIREKNIAWAGVSKDEFMSIIGVSDIAMFLWNEINIALETHHNGEGELYIGVKAELPSITQSRSEAMRYNGKGTGTAFILFGKNFFQGVDSKDRLLEIIHELYHAMEMLTGTMYPGNAPNGLPWSEAYAMAWQNEAARRLGWKNNISKTYTREENG